MYTRCPECNTYFRITAENLRVANGEVCCGSCETEFNALVSLIDEVPDHIEDNNHRGEVPDRTGDNDHRGEVPDQNEDNNHRGEVPDHIEDNDHEIRADEVPADIGRLEHETGNPDEWKALLGHAKGAPPVDQKSVDENEDSDLYGEIIVLESAPEDDWATSSDDDDGDDHSDDHSNYNGDQELKDPEVSEPVVADELQDIEREFRKVDDDDFAETSADFHRWLNGGLEADDSVETEPASSSRGWLVIVTLLTFVLLGQLLHYNRDALAANSRYGSAVRGLYNRLGLTLYPEWELKSFEVRGTEAVAGDSESSTLNILANVLVVSDRPVGMPMIRVVLHDRWSDPVASGIFRPAEYLGARALRPAVLNPGTTLPVKISVVDPGSEARGYVVDICLPRRSTGLQCQLSGDPFRK